MAQKTGEMHGRDHATDGRDPIPGLSSSSLDIKFGSGTPEGAVTGNVGDVYIRSNGLTGTTVYDKTSGTGNTGWTARVILGGGIVEGDLAFTDIATANASTSNHGLLRKLSGNGSQVLLGDGTFGVVPGGAGLGWDAVVTKTIDESVTSSTVLQADDELTFATTTGGVYIGEYEIAYTGASAGDLKIQPGVEANGIFNVQGYNTSDVVNFTTSQGTTSVTQGAAVTKRALKIWFSFTSAAGASSVLNWAQNGSSGTATIIYAGSLVRYRRIF